MIETYKNILSLLKKKGYFFETNNYKKDLCETEVSVIVHKDKIVVLIEDDIIVFKKNNNFFSFVKLRKAIAWGKMIGIINKKFQEFVKISTETKPLFYKTLFH